MKYVILPIFAAMLHHAWAFDVEMAGHLKTDQGRNRRAHSVLQNDTVNSFNGYLLGFEKVSRKRLFPAAKTVPDAQAMWSGKLARTVFDPSDQVTTFLESRRNDPHLAVPTHAVRLDGSSPAPRETLFSVYDGTWAADYAENRAVDRMWDEISRMRAPLSRALASGCYTHLVLLSMGWNTQQDETILNARDMLREMRAAARANGESFNPLAVVVSWHSYWDLGMLGQILGGVPGRFSLKNKGNDVDEVAQTWLQHLLRDVLVPLKHRHNVPLVLIGHSLGARCVTTAACSSWTVKKEGRASDIDLVIALEGAFPVLRFLEAKAGAPETASRHGKRLVFDGFDRGARHFVFTSSSADESRKLAPLTMLFTDFSPYALSAPGGRQMGRSPNFDHVKVSAPDLRRTASLLPSGHPAKPAVAVDASGFIDGKVSCAPGKQERVATKLAKDQADNGDVTKRHGRSSAHSDIYDCEAGRFLAGCISRYAPSR